MHHPIGQHSGTKRSANGVNDMSPKARTYLYLITTGLFSLGMLGGGVMDLRQPPELVETMKHLGYPAYVMTMLGVGKLLGVAALLAPRLPRLKEWAYAGFAFDLIGASVSHAASGDPMGKILPPLVLLGIAMASWATRPADRRLG